LRFYADDEKGDVYTRTTPEKHLQGFPGILHGGIQCALVDEVAFWTMFDRYKKIALTAKIDMEFLRPVGAASEIEVRGRIADVDGRKIGVEVIIYEQQKVCTKCRVDYIIPGKEVTMRVMGKERFTEKFKKYLDD
jgi:uncharacterized protein (TIGR00369 family)